MANRDSRLVGIGEAMVLLEPAAPATLADAAELVVQVAGAEFNACAAYAALGGEAALATRLGADPFAEQIRRAGRRFGVEIAAERDGTRPTGVFFKDPDTAGARTVYYYRAGSAAASLDLADWERIRRLNPDLILLSGLTAALGPGPERLLRHAAFEARAAGALVVVDANLRPALGRLAEAVRAIREIIRATDVLIVGTDEGEAVFGTTDPRRIHEAARTQGCGEVVVKAGADGCFWFDESGAPHRVPSRAGTVVDAVGAGDAFAGAYLRARSLGLLTEDAVLAASEVAAAIVESPGDVAGLRSSRVSAVRERLLGATRR